MLTFILSALFIIILGAIIIRKIMFIAKLLFSFDFLFSVLILLFLLFFDFALMEFFNYRGSSNTAINNLIVCCIFGFFIYKMYKHNPTLKSSLPPLSLGIPRVIYGLFIGVILLVFGVVSDAPDVTVSLGFWLIIFTAAILLSNKYNCARVLPHLLFHIVFFFLTVSAFAIINNNDTATASEMDTSMDSTSPNVTDNDMGPVEPYDPNPPTINVDAYQRSDGTWVNGHERTLPDDYISNNLSERH